MLLIAERIKPRQDYVITDLHYILYVHVCAAAQTLECCLSIKKEPLLLPLGLSSFFPLLVSLTFDRRKLPQLPEPALIRPPSLYRR